MVSEQFFFLGIMTVKELEERVEQLSHQFNEKVKVLSQQSNDLQELILSLRDQFVEC